MSTSKQDKDVGDNSIKRSTVDTTKIINQTFDDAKNKARKAIDETNKGLPRYMQTVTIYKNEDRHFCAHQRPFLEYPLLFQTPIFPSYLLVASDETP